MGVMVKNQTWSHHRQRVADTPTHGLLWAVVEAVRSYGSEPQTPADTCSFVSCQSFNLDRTVVQMTFDSPGRVCGWVGAQAHWLRMIEKQRIKLIIYDLTSPTSISDTASQPRIPSHACLPPGEPGTLLPLSLPLPFLIALASGFLPSS